LSDEVRRRFSSVLPRFSDPEELLAHFKLREEGAEASEVEAAWYEHGRLFVSATARIHKEVERLLGEELSRLSQMVAVDVSILTVPRAILAQIIGASEDGLTLREGWDKGFEANQSVKRRRFSLCGVAGQVHAIFAGKTKSYVDDVQLVSGGTGFAIIQAEDPVISTWGDGLEIRAQADFQPGSTSARLKIEAGEVRNLEDRTVPATFPSVQAASAGMPQSDGTPAPAPPAMTITYLKTMNLTLPTSQWSTGPRSSRSHSGATSS